MQLGLNTLFDFLAIRDGQSLVLITIVHTQGASYRKAGTMMLVDTAGNSSGLISGGCLEDDLKLHAETVFKNQRGKTVHYDLNDSETSAMWGLGLGCGGNIELWLEPANPANQYAGLVELRKFWSAGNVCTLSKRVRNPDQAHWIVAATPSQDLLAPQVQLNVRSDFSEMSIPVSPVNRLLICGAGPDARPLAALAVSQQWQLGVADHRANYLQEQHFPNAKLFATRAAEFDVVASGPWHAAIIMTHHVQHDVAWLQQLVPQSLTYLGLLGPAARREALLRQANLATNSSVFGPAGLDTGAILPEEIALSIMAHIQSVTRGRQGGAICYPEQDSQVHS